MTFLSWSWEARVDMNKSKLSLSLLVAATTMAASSAFAQTEPTAPPPAAPVTAPAPSAPAAATKWIIDDATPRERPQTIDVIAGARYLGGRTDFVTLGGFFLLPIVPEGFIPNVNETFSLEFGLYLDYYSYSNLGIDYNWTQLTPVGGVRWDFHLTDRWSVFATAKVGSSFAIGADEEAPNINLIAIDSGVGALWHISTMGSLRLQSTYHAPLAVGWSFPL